jgi:energy-coupling factor transporter ATP-binding protein EcfA2
VLPRLSAENSVVRLKRLFQEAGENPLWRHAPPAEYRHRADRQPTRLPIPHRNWDPGNYSGAQESFRFFKLLLEPQIMCVWEPEHACAKVLMFDEPTTGLDPEARRQIWRILTEARGEEVCQRLSRRRFRQSAFNREQH